MWNRIFLKTFFFFNLNRYFLLNIQCSPHWKVRSKRELNPNSNFPFRVLELKIYHWLPFQNTFDVSIFFPVVNWIIFPFNLAFRMIYAPMMINCRFFMLAAEFLQNYLNKSNLVNSKMDKLEISDLFGNLGWSSEICVKKSNFKSCFEMIRTICRKS